MRKQQSDDQGNEHNTNLKSSQRPTVEPYNSLSLSPPLFYKHTQVKGNGKHSEDLWWLTAAGFHQQEQTIWWDWGRNRRSFTSRWRGRSPTLHKHITYACMRMGDMWRSIRPTRSTIHKAESPSCCHCAAGTCCWSISYQPHYRKKEITITYVHWIHSPSQFLTPTLNNSPAHHRTFQGWLPCSRASHQCSEGVPTPRTPPKCFTHPGVNWEPSMFPKMCREDQGEQQIQWIKAKQSD